MPIWSQVLPSPRHQLTRPGGGGTHPGLPELDKVLADEDSAHDDLPEEEPVEEEELVEVLDLPEDEDEDAPLDDLPEEEPVEEEELVEVLDAHVNVADLRLAS